MAMNVLKFTLLGATLGTLAACGGGSTGGSQAPTTTPAPVSTVVAGGLNDTTVTSARSVTVLDLSGTSVGQFTPSDQQATVGSATLDVANAAVNDGLGSVVVLNGDEFAFIPATGTAPTGTAVYEGQGILTVTEAASSTMFEGTTDARLTLVFGNSAGGSIDFTGFSGTEQVGTAAPVAAANQRMRITGIVTNTNGISGGSTVTTNTFSDTNFSGANFDVDGAFAGDDFAEIGGVLVITATNGSVVKAGFGAAR